MTVTAFGVAPLNEAPYDPIREESSPRAVIVLNGSRYATNGFQLVMNAHGATDSGSLVLPIEGNPDFTVELYRDETDQSDVFVEVWGGFPDAATSATDIAQLTLRFAGIVDSYATDEEAGTVAFRVRSLGAPLVDNKITFLAQNITSVEYAKQIAAQYGLSVNAQVIGDPITVQEAFAREFMGGPNYAAAIANLHPWDILLKCAQFDDVDVWVDRRGVLNYAAPSAVARTSVKLKYGRDIARPQCSHSTKFARDIEVEVRSYRKKIKQATTTIARTIAAILGGGVETSTVSKKVESNPVFGTDQVISQSTNANGVQSTTVTTSSGGHASSGFTTQGRESNKMRYIYSFNGLTPQLCNKLAQSIWRQISMHEYAVSLVMPVRKDWLDAIDITSLLEIDGFRYVFFNDTYWPRVITEDFSLDHGWTWTIEAVNHVLPQGAV